MMKTTVRALVLILLCTPSAFAAVLTATQQQFVNNVVPIIQDSDGKIMRQRQHLLALYKSYEKGTKLSSSDKKWLQQLANNYDVNDNNFSSRQVWQALLHRVDTVPVSLVLAQAANESAWGRSRFAQQGNNLFGQWCFSQGCGLIPRQRPAGRTYEVKAFPSRAASVQAYIHNLNTHGAYRDFRSLRYELRQQGKPLNGYILATGLSQYSTRRQAYVDSLQTIINSKGLASYDNGGGKS